MCLCLKMGYYRHSACNNWFRNRVCILCWHSLKRKEERHKRRGVVDFNALSNAKGHLRGSGGVCVAYYSWLSIIYITEGSIKETMICVNIRWSRLLYFRNYSKSASQPMCLQQMGVNAWRQCSIKQATAVIENT